MPRQEPFQQLADFIAAEKARYTNELVMGKWPTEAAGRALVARLLTLTEIYEEMCSIAGPGTHFGETDL